MTIAERLDRALAESRLPAHMHDGLRDYILHGVLPGHFLTAVLENDLAEACARADDTNRRLLFEYVAFLYNDAPAGCWGSPDRVLRWRELRGMKSFATTVPPITHDPRRT